ncbi:hypothetical protein XM38_010360 [Halomicronema hongdechloris C2206]|uniref:Uncharacterized protein n=1 Tax=Halomicronema hongdechloris C2206 TaxID=1641165 RepID=A0A1Z3HIL6_9CYAN|nr:hypothetical protein XM38_010360 [Halomicronema hongdechloris C2206]
MANVDNYRQLVQDLLEDYSKVDFNFNTQSIGVSTTPFIVFN